MLNIDKKSSFWTNLGYYVALVETIPLAWKMEPKTPALADS